MSLTLVPKPAADVMQHAATGKITGLAGGTNLALKGLLITPACGCRFCFLVLLVGAGAGATATTAATTA